MAFKSTGAASPVSPLGLVAMTAYGTLAGRSLLLPGEAHDAVLFQLLFQIADVLPVLPLAHTLIVMASGMLPANAVRVANEESFDAALLAEIRHYPDALGAQVADSAIIAQSELRSCPPELTRASRALLTAGSLSLDFAQLLAVQALEG